MRIEPPMAIEDLPECVLEAGEGEPIGPMTVNQYLQMPETRRRESLVYGWLVREPGIQKTRATCTRNAKDGSLTRYDTDTP